MIITTKALTKEEREQIAKEINELSNDEQHIVNAENVKRFGFSGDITYIAFFKDCNVLYQPGTEEPVRKVPFED